MRRCLHSLLVGVLTFSLCFDAARACGHLRRWRHCAPVCAVPVVVVHHPGGCDPCGVVHAWGVPAGGCGCATRVVLAHGACEEIACGTPLDCGAVTVTAAAVDTVVSGAPAAESVVSPAPTPGGEPTPAPIATVPQLEPVAPASATEPSAPADVSLPETTTPAPENEPASEDAAAPVPGAEQPAEPAAEEPGPQEPATADEKEMKEDEEPAVPEPVVEEPAPEEPAPVTPEPAPQPEPRNVFEDAEEGDAAAAAPAAEPPMEEEGAPADPLPFDLGSDPVDVPGDAPADLPAVEPAAGDEVPAAEPPMEEDETPAPPAGEPAVDEPADEQPAAEPTEEPVPAAEPAARVEPLRRWIDDTASHAVVGRLVDVRGEAVEIVRADGRRLTVPMARLSEFDRGYAADAAPRLAARHGGPRPTDTASR